MGGTYGTQEYKTSEHHDWRIPLNWLLRKQVTGMLSRLNWLRFETKGGCLTEHSGFMTADNFKSWVSIDSLENILYKA